MGIEIRKPFSPELYEKNDRFGIRIAGCALIRDGWVDKARQPVDPYGPDLKGELFGGEAAYVEAEVKHAWVNGGSNFPFGTVQVPGRKEKLLSKPDLFFVTVAKDGRGVLATRGDLVVNSPMKEIRNKYVPEGELFYQVPLGSFVYLPAPPSYALECCTGPLTLKANLNGDPMCKRCSQVFSS